jgi:hypothetical protein
MALDAASLRRISDQVTAGKSAKRDAELQQKRQRATAELPALLARFLRELERYVEFVAARELHSVMLLQRNTSHGYDLLYVEPASGAKGTEVEQTSEAANALLHKIQTLSCGPNAGGRLSWGSADLVTSLEDFGKNVANHFEDQGFRVDNGLSSYYGNLTVSW